MSFLDKGKKDEKKAVVRVLEIDGEFVKEELGFGVKMKKDEKSNCFFIITSSSSLRSRLFVSHGNKIVVDRYCSQYPNHIDNEDHRSEVDKVEISAGDEDVSFVYCKGGRKEEFLKCHDKFHKELHRILFAYAFHDEEMIELTFGNKSWNDDYKLKSVSKKGFEVKRAKGAPIIVCDRDSQEPKVVGIVGVKKNGDLYPVFLTEKTFTIQAGNVNPQEQEDASSFASNKKENGSSKSSTDESKPIKEIDELDSSTASQEKEGQHSSNPRNDKNGKGKGKAPLIVTGLTGNQKDIYSAEAQTGRYISFQALNDEIQSLRQEINNLSFKSAAINQSTATKDTEISSQMGQLLNQHAELITINKNLSSVILTLVKPSSAQFNTSQFKQAGIDSPPQVFSNMNLQTETEVRELESAWNMSCGQLTKSATKHKSI